MTRHCKRCKSFQHAFLVVTCWYATNGPKNCAHITLSWQQVLYRRRHDLFVLSLFHLVSTQSGHAPRPFLFVWFWRESGFPPPPDWRNWCMGKRGICVTGGNMNKCRLLFKAPRFLWLPQVWLGHEKGIEKMGGGKTFKKHVTTLGPFGLDRST